MKNSGNDSGWRIKYPAKSSLTSSGFSFDSRIKGKLEIEVGELQSCL